MSFRFSHTSGSTTVTAVFSDASFTEVVCDEVASSGINGESLYELLDADIVTAALGSGVYTVRLVDDTGATIADALPILEVVGFDWSGTAERSRVDSVTGNVDGNVTGSVASVTAAVTVGTNNDKTGYGLSTSERTATAAAIEAAIINEGDATAVLQAIADKIADDLTVGDITALAIAAAVAGHVDIVQLISDASDATANAAQAAANAGEVSTKLGDPVGADFSADIAAVQSSAGTAATNTGTLLTNLSTLATKFTGITLVGNWLRAIARKGNVNATAESEINADVGDGVGTFSAAADSNEAIRDRGDAEYLTATGFAVPGDAMDFVGAISGAVNDGSATTTSFIGDSGLSATDDIYNGAVLHPTSSALVGIDRQITDYNGTTKVITVSPAWTSAPANGMTFKILGRIQ